MDVVRQFNSTINPNFAGNFRDKKGQTGSQNRFAQTVGIILLHSTAVNRYYPSVMQDLVIL